MTSDIFLCFEYGGTFLMKWYMIMGIVNRDKYEDINKLCKMAIQH